MTTPDPCQPGGEAFEALLKLAEAEQARECEFATVLLGPYTAFTLIAILQLAWRHPGMSEAHKRMIEEIARPLQRLFGPPLAAELERGWDVTQDVAR